MVTDEDTSSEIRTNDGWDLIKQPVLMVALNISDRTLKKWRSHGLKRYKPPGGSAYWYSKREVQQFVMRFMEAE